MGRNLHAMALFLIVWCALTAAAWATNCPPSCQCNAGKVNCTSADLRDFATKLPDDVHTLILSRTEIPELPDLTALHSLKTLVIEQSPAEWLPTHLLDPLTRLVHLEIRDCANLTELPDELFHYQGSLRYLHLGNNALARVPRSLRELDQLRQLNLDGNPLACDCQLFWLANWLETRPKLETSKSMKCRDTKLPLLEQLWQLRCSPVRLQTSTFQLEAPVGQPVVLQCNFSGNPPPLVTWTTPDNRVLRWNDTQQHNGSDWNAMDDALTLLSSDRLQVVRLTRQTAGAYACHASNPLSNVTAFLRVRVTPTGFRRVQWQSLAAGFGCVLAFALVTCLVHGFRYLMDRFGWWECCGLSPRAKQIRHVLEAVEQYKSQQLERLRDNYNAQVHRIRDNCVQQMGKIQTSYQGQVKYLRDVRDTRTRQLATVREQYNDQAKKVYDYTVERLQTVQRNYVAQRARVRKFSAHQLIRLRQTYKFQQKTLNKVLESLPAFYIDTCRTAACARTDSVYFDVEDEPVDVDPVDSIIKQGITTLAPPPQDLDVDGPDDDVAEARNARFLDFSFLFPPMRLPTRLSQWRRRNTHDANESVTVDVDAQEEQQQQPPPPPPQGEDDAVGEQTLLPEVPEEVREPLLEPVEPLLPEATEQVNVVDLEKEDAATDDPAAIHM